MVFQVSSNCWMFMLANALVQVSGCVRDIICVAQITLKFIDHALIVYNWRLFLFKGEDLADLLRLTGLICTPIFVLRFCISLFTELADFWFLKGSGTTILEVPSLASSGAPILSILWQRKLILNRVLLWFELTWNVCVNWIMDNFDCLCFRKLITCN